MVWYSVNAVRNKDERDILFKKLAVLAIYSKGIMIVLEAEMKYCLISSSRVKSIACLMNRGPSLWISSRESGSVHLTKISTWYLPNQSDKPYPQITHSSL